MCGGDQLGQSDCGVGSGGPLAVAESYGSSFIQIGMLSYGVGLSCVRSGDPDVFTSVIHYRNWIEENMKP